MAKKNTFSKMVKNFKKTMAKPYTKGDCVRGVAGSMLAIGALYGGYAIYEAVSDKLEKKRFEEKEKFDAAVDKRARDVMENGIIGTDEENGA